MAAKMIGVLIVDDSALIRKRLGELVVEIDGVEIVGEATSARGGVSLTQRLNPEVVILDIRMPDKSGIDALAEIKGHKPAPSVVVLTNHPYPPTAVAASNWARIFFSTNRKSSTRFGRIVRDLVNRSD